MKTWQYFAPKSAICTLISQLKVTISDAKRRKIREWRKEIGKKNRLTFYLIFISSTLENGANFFNTVFMNSNSL